MVSFCAVINCANRGNRERYLSYFRIPKVRRNDGREKRELKGQQQLKWLANIGRDIKIEKIENYRVCSLHFINKKPAAWNDVTNRDWAPSVNMGRGGDIEQNRQRTQKRHARATKRESVKVDLITAQALVALQDDDEQVNDYENFQPELQVHHELHMETQTPVKGTMDTSTQTEMCAADITALEAQGDNNKELAKARQEAAQMKYTQESLAEDDKKTMNSGRAPQCKYTQLLAIIEELGKDIRPSYAGNKSAMERLKRGIMCARRLVQECLAETERSARSQF
ncbi:uncharacterized protein cdk2ap1 [Rhinoraja longicauda]